MSARSMAAWLLVPAALALAIAVNGKPWTVRPLEGADRRSPGLTSRFDAVAYVETIWGPRVLHAARTAAADLAVGTPGDPSAPPARLVRGTGRITRVDTRSRVGLAFVDLEPGDGRADVALQIGPVLRSTALRDALPFVRFGDFANQLEFADVANALNARVLASVLRGVEAASLEGRAISFWGAMKNDRATPERVPEVVPVILEGGTT